MIKLAKESRLVAVTLIALAISMTALTSCGGGGGGNGNANIPAFSNASLNGVYYGSSFNINPLGTTSSLQKVTFDGNGNVTVDQVFGNASGASQTQTLAATYAVNADGTFTITQGSEITDGRLSADANTAVTARVNSTEVQNISVGVKGAPSGFSNASLNGVYYSSSFNINPAGTTSSVEKATFDGNGNVMIDQIFGNASGASQTQSLAATYTVNADGLYMVTTQGGEISHGLLSADANTAVTARVNSTTVQNISVGVKGAPSGFSNASLNGVYYNCSFNINPSGTTSSIAKLTFDGNGQVTADQIYGNASGANQTQTSAGTYAVNADGTFTITQGAEVTDGRLSADAKTFVTARVDSTTVQNMSAGVKQ